MANVIKTVMTYPLNGTTREFNIPFEYLARKFVQVTLIGVDRKVLTLNTDYRFATKTTIATTQAWGPAQGYQQIEIRRYTSATERLVDFTDGSILRAYDLNISQIQTMHVAEEARDLTADTIGVNNAGHLDARGRRIVNLANAVDDRDAVPFGQLKTMNQNAYDSMNKAQQFRNEAQAFRNQAEALKNDTNNLKNQAAASQSAAKTSETNAKNSENAAAASKNAAATSQAAAKASETNAKNSENAARTEANRSKTEADKSKASADASKKDADRAAAMVESYGALPVGAVVTTTSSKALPGFLLLDGSKFSSATYPALYAYLGTDTLPDFRNRYAKGAAAAADVGKLVGWGIPGYNGIATAAAGNHSHTGNTNTTGNHNHSGTTEKSGKHTHGVNFSAFGSGEYTNRITRSGNQGGYAGSSKFGGILEDGEHTHTFTTATTGNHSHTVTTNTTGNHTHTFDIPARGTGNMDVDHVKVYYWIKAFGTTDDEQMADVNAALQEIHAASAKVDTFESRIKLVEQTRIPVYVPNVPGAVTWYKVGKIRMGQYSAGILITGTGQHGNNVQTGVSMQGVTWLAKVWTSNNNPKAFVSQVNMFGGNIEGNPLATLPIQGICVVEEANSDYGTIYMKLGAYGQSQMLFIEGNPSLLATFVAGNGKDTVVAENPPVSARFGFLSYTKATTQIVSTL